MPASAGSNAYRSSLSPVSPTFLLGSLLSPKFRTMASLLFFFFVSLGPQAGGCMLPT